MNNNWEVNCKSTTTSYPCLWDESYVLAHDDVIKWKHFPRHWPFVREIYRWPVNSPHKGQWQGPLMFSLVCAWIKGWVNTREAVDLRRYRAHYDVTVMFRDSWKQDIQYRQTEQRPGQFSPSTTLINTQCLAIAILNTLVNALCRPFVVNVWWL